VLFVL